MAEYSDGVREIAKALMPEAPGAREKRELYEQVGRAIVKLSDIEMLLAMVFVIITPRKPEDAAAIFYEQQSLERRLSLVDFMAKGELTDKEMVTWQGINSEIRTHKGLRNLIAHQRMFVGQPNHVGEVQVSLVPPWLKKGGKELNISEIRRTADALNKIHGDLWKFIGTLHRK